MEATRQRRCDQWRPNGLSAGEVVPEGGIIDINKTVTKIDKKNMEVSWETIVDVPKNGLPRAIVYDVYPTATSANGETLVERIKPDTVEISGLQSGEAYTVNYDATYGGKAAMTITFTKNGQPGLIGTGQERQVMITYKTTIDSTWLKEAVTDDGKIAHLNSVWLQYDGWVGDEETAYIRPYAVDKNAVPVATRTVDGGELPVYRYEVTLMGTDYDDLTITDKFDTEILELYDDGEGANYMYGGERLDNLYAQGFEQVAHQDITGGVQFTLTSGSRQLRRTADGGYFTYYKLVYYLTVKDAAALEKLGMRAVADGGETELTNEASWEEQTDTSTVAYAYNGLDKELLNEEDLHVDGGDIYAEFRITLNPAAQKLNGGEPLTMTDTVSNLSVDITSIKAEPSADVTWDMSGNTVTYTIPDQTKVVITYRARVLFTSSGALVTTFSNHAEMEGYYDDVDGSAERQNSGSGSGSVPSINLMKYEVGNMTKRLAGAKFQLLFGNKQPVLDKNGNPVIFTTYANGMITVEGDQEEDGWTIIEDTKYYLREIEAPPHYMLASFDYSFQVSSDGTTDYSQYIYHSGDTMSAKNYPGTDVQVEKVWTDGYGNHESDTVTVKLQQKIGDEDWSDTIREEVKQSDGSYVWVDTAAKVLTLDNNNDWKGTFASLPLEVPNPLPVSDESVDVAVEYRVIETKVNDIDVTPDESDPTAGTYNGGTVTIERTSDTS